MALQNSLKMLSDVLERNRRTREYNNIRGKCVKYAYKPKLFAYDIIVESDGITMDTTERELRGNMYVWYEVYYDVTYILIKDVSTSHMYYIHPRIMTIEYLTMLIHDLIITGCNILFLLETDENNSSMKRLLIDLYPQFGILLKSNHLYTIAQVSCIPMNYNKVITYNVLSYVIIYRFVVRDGDYNFKDIILTPSLGRIYKIMSKYVVGIL